MTLLDAYRRKGADLPFGDPVRAHGVAMEGYYWRVTDTGRGRVVIALCGVCRAPDGAWALVALAAQGPTGPPLVRTSVMPVASADGFDVQASDAANGCELTARVGAEARGLRVELGSDARLELRIEDEHGWPRRSFGGLGPAQVVPGLPQYWHPYLLSARARGSLAIGDERWELDGASVYCEKNWGSEFSPHWWWGQSHALGDDPATCVAFAGGRISLAGVGLAPTAVVAAVGGSVIRLAPPFAVTHASVGGDAWRIRARGPVHSIEIEGDAGGHPVPVLPTPVVPDRTTEPRSYHALAGRMDVTLRRGRRTLLRAQSRFAGLERAVHLPG